MSQVTKLTQKQRQALLKPVWTIKSAFCLICGFEKAYPFRDIPFVEDEHGDLQKTLPETDQRVCDVCDNCKRATWFSTSKNMWIRELINHPFGS